MSTIGFILLTYNKPAQTKRLVDRLGRSFGNPAIVCHHDFGKQPLSTEDFPSVTFVRPHIDTAWGAFSVVEAFLAALDMLYSRSNGPDWFVLLSGACYPIKSGHQILYELEHSPYDAYLHHELIDPLAIGRDWHRLCCERYLGTTVSVPTILRKLGLVSSTTIYLQSRLLPFLDAPFSKKFRCFAGEHWFTANRKSAEYILKYHKEKPALARRYRNRTLVDESYIHCILGNAHNLRVTDDCKRYIDWVGGAHPKTLTVDDLPHLISSSAHFARKFDSDVDCEVLDRIDEMIG